MKSLCPRYNEEQVELAITKMFHAATNTINGPITCSKTEFWGLVKLQVVWLRAMNEEDIMKFSWKVLSARAIASEIYDTELENLGMTVEEAPPMEVT